MNAKTPDSFAELIAFLRSDQADRWRSGEVLLVEDYLERYPELVDRVDGIIELIHSEWLLRVQAREKPTLDEYLQRFPIFANALRASWMQLETTHIGNPVERGMNETISQHGSQSQRNELYGRIFPGLELFEKLGEGGMGVVYRAKDILLDQPRAVKIIRSGPFAGEEARERFIREARAVARLTHPGVVRIHSLGEHQEILYLCMDFIDGGNLRDRLYQGPLDIPLAAKLVCSLAHAVQHAHEHKVLHRDLKPANILLTPEGEAKITDFGLAKILDNEEDMTFTGTVMGTPAYMSPEQAKGRISEIDERSDIWSLGIILYECLVGSPPFKGETREETIENVKKNQADSMVIYRAEIPRDLEAICRKCLEKLPQNRYRSARELADDLDAWTNGKPISIRPQSWKNRWLARWRLLTFFLVVGIGIGILIFSRGTDEENGFGSEPPKTANTIYPLLSKEPIVLRWPSEERDSFKILDPVAKELKLSCEELGLLSLGETNAKKYKLQITMKQNPWVGNIGIFFGYKEGLLQGKPAQKFQTIQLVQTTIPEEGQVIRLDWKSHYLLRNNDRWEPNSSTNAPSNLFALKPIEHRLGIEVSPEGLESVTWDGKIIEQLQSKKLLQSLEPDAFQGKFGIFVWNGNGVFREATYQFHEEP